MENTVYKKPEQDIYDAFNTFIFADNTSIINKLLMRHAFYLQIKDLPGSIVECGVFKGSGMATWLKILELYEPNSNKKVIGFDFFQSTEETIKEIEEKQYVCGDALKEIVNRNNNIEDTTYRRVREKLNNICKNTNKYELVKGDIQYTSTEYCDKNKGFYISLLYMDLDIGEATYYALKNLWDRVLPGGLIIFDEYQAYFFDEASGVNKFLKEIGYEYCVKSTQVGCPDAYMIKK